MNGMMTGVLLDGTMVGNTYDTSVGSFFTWKFGFRCHK